MSWRVVCLGDERHVEPVNDLIEHYGTQCCWCRPSYDGDSVWVHNSKDGREFQEPDYRFKKQ